MYIERENFVFLSNSYLISFFSNFFFIFSFSPLISSFSKTQTSRCRKNVFFSVRERNFGRLRERRPKCFLSFNFLLSMEKRNFRDCCKTLSISACGNISWRTCNTQYNIGTRCVFLSRAATILKYKKRRDHHPSWPCTCSVQFNR